MNNSNKTQLYEKTQLGYFIDYKLWKDALELLNFQIEQKKKHRNLNTISMFYYEKLDLTCLDSEEYFNMKIASSLFYGLKKEFSVLSYPVPKHGLGLRDYKFFTYPMRAIYYAVGLYLLKLSQNFLTETYKKVENINAFYGGKLYYKANKIQLSYENIYFWNFYKKYKQIIEPYKKIDKKNEIAIKIDVQNYFNELSISKLLHFLNHYIKPSVQAKLHFDIYTIEQIVVFFSICCK